MANTSIINDSELSQVNGGYDYNLDTKNMEITVTLQENESAAAALADLPAKLPSFVKLSADAQTTLTAIANEMDATQKRNLYVKFAFKMLILDIESYTIS